MNTRNFIFAAVLIALLAVMLLDRSPEVKGPLPTERSTSPIRSTREGTTAPAPATQPENSPTPSAAGNLAAPEHSVNLARPSRGPGPVVQPRAVAADHANSNNPTGTSAAVALDPAITPPPTPVMPLPVELNRTDAPVVPPGRDRPYSGP